jgi:glycosyltransferase involved in cell wall biosynthesis
VTLLNMWDGGGDMYRLCQQRGDPCELLEVGQRRFRPEALPKLRRFVKEGQFDIVMAYGLRTSLLLRIVSPSHRASGPVRVTGLRGIDDWRRWYHVWADRLTDGWMDYFVGVSQSVCRRHIERERTPPEKMLYIPNGIDTDHFRRDAQNWPGRSELKLPNGPLCISVGNYRRAKGYPFQIEVIASLKHKQIDAHFVWVGRGPDEDELRRLAAQHDVADRITFYGHCDDVRPLLANADVFFLSSREEGMPRALMEAMGMGMACLATDVGGVGEVLQDTVQGFIVPYGSIENASTRLADLLCNAQLRREVGIAATEKVRKSFSFDTIAQQYCELFHSMAAGNRAGVAKFAPR